MISSILLGISFQLMRLKPTSGQLVMMCVAVAVILRVSVDVAISLSVIVSVTVKNSEMVVVGSEISVFVIVTVLTDVTASLRDVSLVDDEDVVDSGLRDPLRKMLLKKKEKTLLGGRWR